jgi:cell fate (sporulation/competence/biofilm development) regulator YlbF (YheA/YmcA/DUF963 family)
MVHIETAIKNIDKTINELETKIHLEPDPVFHEMLNRFIKIKEKYQEIQRKNFVYDRALFYKNRS